MLFKDVQLFSVFSHHDKLYVKVSNYFGLTEGKLSVGSFSADTKVSPVAKTFKITFDSLLDTVDIGKDFEYNGTMYKKTAGHRQALNLTTFHVETFI